MIGALRVPFSSSCGGLEDPSGLLVPLAPSKLQYNYILNQSPTSGGSVLYNFLFKTTLYMFVIFRNFRGSLIFIFEIFERQT